MTPCRLRQLRGRWYCEQQPPQLEQHWRSQYNARSLQYRTLSCSIGRHGFCSSPSRFFSTDVSKHQLRIAIVGGGAAGMAAALHLSPLVAAGLVNGPIDVYEANSERQRSRSGQNGGKQVYPGSGAAGRDIGVGIWSSAWWPFLRSLEVGLLSASMSENRAIDSLSSLANKVQREKNRLSYRTLLQDLEACGSYVGNVGYRTPDGSWLVKSELNASPFGVLDLLSSSMTDGNMSNDNNNKAALSTKTINDNEHHPALLFVREKDLLSCLRNAINMESRLGNVKYHTGIRVDGIANMDGDLGSLLLCSTDDEKTGTQGSATSLSPQYNLIIAADGLYSSLRARFAGHRSIHATGGIGSSSTSSRAPSFSSFDENSTVGYKWEHTQGQREATEVEDREYIVFRGNAPKLTTNYCGVVDDACDVSFQTWGEKDSMRFAAVPFRHQLDDPSLKDNSGNVDRYSNSESFINSKTKEEEVWFATISDPIFINAFKSTSSTDDAIDSNRMKQLLLEAFGSWHQPVKTLIETTPSDAIMYELAVAHRHSAGPVCDVGRILEFERWQASMNRKMKEAGGNEVIPFPPDEDGRINGRGPILVFIGDAMMTVDPVLAQGFTIAMESGASIVQSIEHILLRQHSQATTSSSVTPPIMYHPKLLRDELLQRHNHRERRLLQLLRSTELVQRMAQPHGFGSTLLATWIVRPIIKLCPDSLKMKVFDYMIRYSLGLTGDQK